MSLKKTPKTQHTTIRNSAVVKTINQTISSPWGIGILGLLTFFAFAFSLEVEFYTFVVLYAIYVAIFADDFSPLIPLFPLCYITPSTINNPGKSEQGLFYGSSGLYLVGIVYVGVMILLLRIALDENFGFRRLFTMKRTMLVGMLALGTSYFLSGIAHEQYLEYAKGNLLFAFIQFASVFLLYFIFSATIKWDRFDIEYFAWVGLIVGLVVAAEVGYIYWTQNVIVDGVIVRYNISSGWGCYNNIGAMISTSIPFAFYFACRKKNNWAFIALACFLLLAVIASNSRGSMVGAVFSFVVGFIYTCIKCNNKKQLRLVSCILFCALAMGILIFREQLATIFRDLPGIISVDKESTVIHDSDRLNIYKNGIEVFLRNPIFGQTFYPIEYDIYSFSEVAKFNSFFPERWHNTIVQMLASCGAVGMIAYAYHRFDTIRLYVKKRTLFNTYTFLFILTLLLMSLLDCHFFNVGPVFLYSTGLAVMEFGQENRKNIA